jgi:5-methylthioadenosine/S-adenosylhomocysteine deaminase
MTTLRIADGLVLGPDLTFERADVLVDREAGEILAVGQDVEPGTETLDASDGLVIPGLVNAHTHVSMTLLRGHADDKPLDPWLQEDIWPVEAELTPEDIRVGAELGVAEMIKAGTTTFADMYFEMDQVAAVVAESGLRALLGYGSITIGRETEAARDELETGLSFAREFDGAADGRISTAFMPHSLTTVGEQYYREYVQDAREAGVPIHLHANETTDEVDPIVAEHGMRPLEYARDLGLLDAEDFLAHCVHVDETEIELLAETGAAAIHCPASNMKLASGMAPVQQLRDHGVTVGLGTDGAASNNDLDPFDELRDAAMLGKLAADDAAAVDAETAFELATVGGARALGVDSGTIEPGRNADLAVVDLDAPHLTPAHDHLSNLVYATRGSDVRHTICDGQVLMADRELQTIDEAAVRSAATEHARALVERAAE